MYYIVDALFTFTGLSAWIFDSTRTRSTLYASRHAVILGYIFCPSAILVRLFELMATNEACIAQGTEGFVKVAAAYLLAFPSAGFRPHCEPVTFF